MKDYKLNEEEKDILEAFENKKLKSTENLKKLKKELQEAAENTLAKSKHISLRISEKDLTKLRIYVKLTLGKNRFYQSFRYAFTPRFTQIF